MARSATLLPALLAPLACPNDVSTLKLLHAWQEKHHQFGYFLIYKLTERFEDAIGFVDSGRIGVLEHLSEVVW